MQRRSFLKTSLTASLAAAIPRLGFANSGTDALVKYRETIGLQLWTVRNQMKEDLTATLEAVVDAGYWQVELGNVTENIEVAKKARELGLKVTSAFINWNSICRPEQIKAGKAPSTDSIIDAAESLNLKHLVFGYIGKGSRETADHFKAHAAAANAFGEQCQKAGIQACYHNHAFEFGPIAGAKNGFEVFINEFDAKLMPFELDVFWATLGGYDPLKRSVDLRAACRRSTSRT